jgi:hypothetical protein
MRALAENNPLFRNIRGENRENALRFRSSEMRNNQRKVLINLIHILTPVHRVFGGSFGWGSRFAFDPFR